MSLDYTAKNKKLADFGVNVSGAALLYFIHVEAKAKVMADIVLGEPSLRIPYEATKKECQGMAKAIGSLTPDQIVTLHRKQSHCHSMSEGEFICFVLEWKRFLERCNGYEAI